MSGLPKKTHQRPPGRPMTAHLGAAGIAMAVAIVLVGRVVALANFEP